MSHSVSADTLCERFANEFHLGRVKLPVLPDLAFRLHDLMSEANYDPAFACQALSQESGVAAKLVGAANSVLNRGRVEVATLDMAVMRLGRERTQSLTNAHLLKQLFHGSPAGKALLQAHWDSIQAKSIRATFLADLCDEVEPAEALLLSLLQGLGGLPIVAWLESQNEFEFDQTTFNEMDAMIGADIAQSLLKHWNYSDAWIGDVGRRDQWCLGTPGPLNRTDLCLLASWAESDLQGQPVPNLDSVPAFAKWHAANLPIDDGIGNMRTEESQSRLAALQDLLA